MYQNHRRAIFALVLVLALAPAALLLGCGGDSATTTTAAPTTETTAPTTETTGGGSAIDAAALYSTNCSSCHGADGSGGVGPDLRAEDNTERITAQVTNGGGSMPAFGDKLSAEEISALADYVVGLE